MTVCAHDPRMDPESESASWVVCQRGAREHYAVARSLAAGGNLKALVTDIWVRPSSISATLPSQLTGRWHPDLHDARVLSYTLRSVARQMIRRGYRPGRTEHLVRDNDDFQTNAIRTLRALPRRTERVVLFSYSYAAGRLFRYAKEQGWTTVLGQIDPGPKEERVVAELTASHGAGSTGQQETDPAFWQNWREEVELADHVVVNSEWSRKALLEEGVAQRKTIVIPLAYEASIAARSFRRLYPLCFTQDRPLRVLFLGQVNLRKGAHVLFDVCRRMRGLPIQFVIVGPLQVELPSDLRDAQNVRWVGRVARSRVDDYLRTADLFLFPTFSDGFGLTQLEAQSWQLPVIASRFCGDVITDGVNGRVLGEISTDSIVTVLNRFLIEPDELVRLSTNSGLGHRFSTQAIRSALLQIEAGGQQMATPLRSML